MLEPHERSTLTHTRARSVGRSQVCVTSAAAAAGELRRSSRWISQRCWKSSSRRRRSTAAPAASSSSSSSSSNSTNATPPPPLQAAAAHVSGSATLAAARRLGNVRLPPLCRCLEGGGGLLCTYTYGFVRRGLTGRLRGPYNQCVLSVTLCLSIRTSKKESSDFRFQISDFRIQGRGAGRGGGGGPCRFQISGFRFLGI